MYAHILLPFNLRMGGIGAIAVEVVGVVDGGLELLGAGTLVDGT